jgi:hypothetical protein
MLDPDGDDDSVSDNVDQCPNQPDPSGNGGCRDMLVAVLFLVLNFK